MKLNDLKSATRFVVLLGLVSLFADMTYEGARSITGPYLALFGASAAAVGFVAGFGELIGYGLRLVSGYISDKTKQYWTITFFGYFVNLIAVPFLALAGNWPVAAALMIAERTGKAIRNPARDAMLSHATHQMGHGWGFGLHEAMDQIGAMLGPLIVALVLYFRGGDYRTGFAILLIPALLALSTLLMARFLYPRPHDLEINVPSLQSKGLTRSYWLYILGVGLVAAGFADFPLIAYHFQKVSTIPQSWIPIFYSVAMGSDALAALIFGRLFDRLGMGMILIATLIGIFFAPLVFLGGFSLALAGMILWGISMGAQESIMKAFIAGLVAPGKRGTAFGIFNAFYGVFWFCGSLALGFLYDVSIPLVILFSMGLQALSVPLFVMAARSHQKAQNSGLA